MKRQLRIFLTGLFVVVPFAVTVWVIWKASVLLDGLGMSGLQWIWERLQLDTAKVESLYGLGAVLLVVAIYLIGLLMHFWLFRYMVSLAERIFEHVPGVKTIYESVRDLLKLFGSESKKMGQVVEYTAPGSDAGRLGILTNEQPDGASDGQRVAVYFPLAYMIGGPVFFVNKENLREVDMPVERALRLCATAQVGIETAGQGAVESGCKADDSPSAQDDTRQQDQEKPQQR